MTQQLSLIHRLDSFTGKGDIVSARKETSLKAPRFLQEAQEQGICPSTFRYLAKQHQSSTNNSRITNTLNLDEFTSDWTELGMN